MKKGQWEGVGEARGLSAEVKWRVRNGELRESGLGDGEWGNGRAWLEDEEYEMGERGWGDEWGIGGRE